MHDQHPSTTFTTSIASTSFHDPDRGTLLRLRRSALARDGVVMVEATNNSQRLLAAHAIEAGNVIFREQPFVSAIQNMRLGSAGAMDHVLACQQCMRCVGTIGEQMAHLAGVKDPPTLPTLPGIDAPCMVHHCPRGCGTVYCSQACVEEAEYSHHWCLCPCVSKDAAEFDEAARRHVPEHALLAARLLISTACEDAKESAAQSVSQLAALEGLCDSAFHETISAEEMATLGFSEDMSAGKSLQAHIASLSALLTSAISNAPPTFATAATAATAATLARRFFDPQNFSRLMGRLRLNTQTTRVPSVCMAYVEALGAVGGTSEEADSLVDESLAALGPVLEALQTSQHVTWARAEASLENPGGKAADEEGSDEEAEPQLDASAMFPGPRGIGLFLLQSAMNHACDAAANTVVTTADTTRRAEILVVATKDIAAGEELTFDYHHSLTPPGAAAFGVENHRGIQGAKRAAIESQYRFRCYCATCVQFGFGPEGDV